MALRLLVKVKTIRRWSMLRIAAPAMALVLVCNVALAASPRTKQKSSASWVRRQVANAVLPPKAMRTPENMKRPILSALAWQVHKVVSPAMEAATDIMVDDFEKTRTGRFNPLSPLAKALTYGLLLSVVATMAVRDARPAKPDAPAVQPSGLAKTADSLVLKADRALRKLAGPSRSSRR